MRSSGLQLVRALARQREHRQRRRWARRLSVDVHIGTPLPRRECLGLGKPRACLEPESRRREAEVDNEVRPGLTSERGQERVADFDISGRRVQ